MATENKETIREKTLKLAQRLMEISDESIYQGILRLTNLLNQQEDDCYNVTNALVEAYEFERNENTSGYTRKDVDKQLPIDFIKSNIYLDAVAGALDDQHRNLLYAYIRNLALSTQGRTDKKTGKPTIHYRAQKLFFSLNGIDMKDALRGFFMEYGHLIPNAEDVKQKANKIANREYSKFKGIEEKEGSNAYRSYRPIINEISKKIIERD